MEEKKEPAIPESGLTLEKLLERMDALRSEMQDLTQTIHIVDGLPESPDAMARSKAIGDMFVEREKTLRQQLSFLERIYTDRFSTGSEAGKTERTRMILDKMNDIIPCFDYSEEDNEGKLESAPSDNSALQRFAETGITTKRPCSLNRSRGFSLRNGFLGRGSGGNLSLGPKRPENLPLGWFSAKAGPEGPG